MRPSTRARRQARRGYERVTAHRRARPAQWPAGGKAMGRTLAEKVWDDHVVRRADGEPDLLYIDLHLLHEETSPQAIDGLRGRGRTGRRPDPPITPENHTPPALEIDKPIAAPVSRTQLE